MIPVPAGTPAQRLAILGRIQGIAATTSAPRITMPARCAWATTSPTPSRTISAASTTPRNCYVAGPALFPTSGSPNPMLTGVALGRRTGDLLNTSVLPGPDPIVSPQSEAGFRALYSTGRSERSRDWRLAGPPTGGGMAPSEWRDGELRGRRLAAVLLCDRERSSDFTLRLQFRIFDAAKHNSGVFIRFPRPTLELADALKTANQEKPALMPAIPPGSQSLPVSKCRSMTTRAGIAVRTLWHLSRAQRPCTKTAPAQYTRFKRAIASGI